MNHLEAMKLRAEIHKFTAESDHLLVTTRWYPVVVAGGLMTAGGVLVGAIAAIVKAFL